MTPDDVPDAVAAHILAAAAAAQPREACGVLLGTAAGIARAPEVPNGAEDPHRFAIDADTVLRLQREAEADGLDILGFWHSHPNGPGTPSRADLEGALPGYLYVIADLRTGAVSAWRLREDRTAFEPA